MIMLKERFDIAFALRRLAEAMQSLSDEDLLKLTDENFSVDIKISRRRGKTSTEISESKDSIKILSEKLLSIQDRNEAFTFLSSNFKTRKTLENVARIFDVSVLKTDKFETLAEKIVEATVGARKRSEAIQGYSNFSTEKNKSEPQE